MADKLLAWKGRLMHMSGCLTQIKSTLATVPVQLNYRPQAPGLGEESHG
jgi:hypothetical protein